MVNFQRMDRYDMDALIRIMELLRAPEGCPWDREQTHTSIRKNFIEETYEVLEAIDTENAPLLQEELGDVLFAAVKVGRFAGKDSELALHGTCEKFIRRFERVEKAAPAPMKDMALEDLVALWEQAKHS